MDASMIHWLSLFLGRWGAYDISLPVDVICPVVDIPLPRIL